MWACVPAPGLRPWLSSPYPSCDRISCDAFQKVGHTESSASVGICLSAPFRDNAGRERQLRATHGSDPPGSPLSLPLLARLKQEACPREGSVCGPPSFRTVLGRDLSTVLRPIGQSSEGIFVWSSVLQEDPREGSVCGPLSYRKILGKDLSVVRCPTGRSSGGICVQSSILQEDPREGSVCSPLSYRKILGRDLCAELHPAGRSLGGICLWSSVLQGSL